MKTTLCSFAAMICSSLCVPAQQVINYPEDEPIFSIEFPEEWDVEIGDESVSASSEDELVNMELLALDSEALEEAIEAAKESLAEEFDEIKWDGKPEKGEMNGMDVRFLNAKVKIEDVEMAVNCAVFAPKGKATFFMLLNMVPMESLKDHGDAISGIITSVKASAGQSLEGKFLGLEQGDFTHWRMSDGEGKERSFFVLQTTPEMEKALEDPDAFEGKRCRVSWKKSVEELEEAGGKTEIDVLLSVEWLK